MAEDKGKRLTSAEQAEIRAALLDGTPPKQLAEHYDVTPVMIHRYRRQVLQTERTHQRASQPVPTVPVTETIAQLRALRQRIEADLLAVDRVLALLERTDDVSPV